MHSSSKETGMEDSQLVWREDIHLLKKLVWREDRQHVGMSQGPHRAALRTGRGTTSLTLLPCSACGTFCPLIVPCGTLQHVCLSPWSIMKKSGTGFWDIERKEEAIYPN